MSFAPILLGFISIIVPGFFLALALLKKTRLNIFEIVVIGFIFGLIFPPTMVWAEAYLMNSIHAFTFSAGLYNANVILLTIIGIALSFQQGAFDFLFAPRQKHAKEASSLEEIKADYKDRISHLRRQLSAINVDMVLVRKHEEEEEILARKHMEEIKALKEKGAGAEELQRISESHRQEERNLMHDHEAEEKKLLSGEKPKERNSMHYAVWAILLVIMLVTFSSRIINIGVAPKYFEFDPYFDMLSTQQILAYGYQLKLDYSAWPVNNGTIDRIQPLVPYLEAYWYDITNTNSTSSSVNTTLLSNVSSFYPPIVAALLVFVVFMFVYHEYGSLPALITAALAAIVPTLITTFIAGEQLVEPWGIFALFFMVAAYSLATKYPKEKRYALLAGIAFASNFLGAHYYNVTAGVLAVYILIQSEVNAIRDKNNMDFYKMNAIMLLVIIIFYAIYAPYNATLTNRVPSILGIPTIISFPLLALVAALLFGFLTDTLHSKFIPREVASIPKKAVEAFEKYYIATLIICAASVIGLVAIIIDYLQGGLKKHVKAYSRYAIILIITVIAFIVLLVTPLGKPINDYISLAQHFTTPSTPLFMTVQEYVVTGPLFNFGGAGFGIIGASIYGFPLMIWLVLVVFGILTIYSIIKANSSSAIFNYSMLLVLAVAAMSEVKYLPHFAAAYIIAIGVIIGEVFAMVKIMRKDTAKNSSALYGIGILAVLIEMMLLIASTGIYGLGFVILGIAIAVIYSYTKVGKSTNPGVGLYSTGMSAIILGLFVLAVAAGPLLTTFTGAGSSCTQLSNSNEVVAATLYCNTLTPQWLNALSWMRANVGPFAPRILSWWDYGDWINWFGNSNAVIRGDNAVASLDYAVAAHFVLGSKDGYNASVLAKFMDTTAQAKYVLFDDQLVPKWSALDFLACVDINQTSQAYAISQGKLYGRPFLTGTSPCELEHDPVVISIPEQPTINQYCSSTGATPTVQAVTFVGETIPSALNVSYCVQTTQNKEGTLNVYNSNGTKANVVLTPSEYLGAIAIGPNSQTYLEFLAIYLPNGPNDTITNAPTEFYNSTYYRGFFFGRLPGFTLVYPRNFSGINMVNSTNTVMILEQDNYTGTLPYVPPKPSWVQNNYTIPG